jgi:hypothetical protein
LKEISAHSVTDLRTLPSPMDSRWNHLESRWNFFAGSPAKLLSNSTWNPGGIQMVHVEHVEFHSLHLLDTDISVDFTWTPLGLEDFTLLPNLLILNPNPNPNPNLTLTNLRTHVGYVCYKLIFVVFHLDLPGVHKIQVESMESTWTPYHNYQNRQYWVESMSPCGICGVHLESMGEGKVHL